MPINQSASQIISVGILPSYTWANRPSAVTAGEKTKINISDIGVGGQGSQWYSDGANWRPVGNSIIIGGSATEVAVSNITPNTTINIHRSIALPAGIILPNCSAEITAKWAHSGSTNNKFMRVYLGGSAGTVLCQYNNVTASAIVSDMAWSIDFITSGSGAGTQIGKVINSPGTGSSASSHYTGSVNTTAATTIDIASNMSATNESITLKSCTVILKYR